MAYIITRAGPHVLLQEALQGQAASQKQPEGEGMKMECLNGEGPWKREAVPYAQVLSALQWPWRKCSILGQAEPHPPLPRSTPAPMLADSQGLCF